MDHAPILALSGQMGVQMFRCKSLSVLCLSMGVGCGFNPAVDGPPAGNPDGHCGVPPDLEVEDSSHPDHVVGSGTPDSCTSQAFLDAVEQGGIITFNCGPDPITLHVNLWAEIIKDSGPKIVIDGGNKVALTTDGRYQILTLNACRRKGRLDVSDCGPLDPPQLTVQNLTFIDAGAYVNGSDGGGAIAVQDGHLKVVNCRFFSSNVIVSRGNYGGGAAIYARSYYKPSSISIVNSTFGGGPGLGNLSTNGGAIAVTDASIEVLNSLFTDNVADDSYGLIPQTMHPGNGAGGAIFLSSYETSVGLELCGVRMTGNRATGAGGAIFFDARQPGYIQLRDSTITDNHSQRETGRYAGISTMGDVDISVW